MIKAGIIGGEKHIAGELVRLLINHPDVDLQWVNSPEHHGKRIDSAHTGLIGEIDLKFTGRPELSEIDVLFSCLDSGMTRQFINDNDIPEELRIIDLSGDYNDETDNFFYGLPELNRKRIVRGASRIAVPDAISSVIYLALLPLAKNSLLEKEINITTIYSSGNEKLSFSNFTTEADNDCESTEIKHRLYSLQPGLTPKINHLSIKGGCPRGTMATIYFDSNMSVDGIIKLCNEYYDDHNFTFILPEGRTASFSDVINTNKCVISVAKSGAKVAITAVIDSLIKGAAGTAIHNMNLLFGLSEKTGLCLKSSYF